MSYVCDMQGQAAGEGPAVVYRGQGIMIVRQVRRAALALAATAISAGTALASQACDNFASSTLLADEMIDDSTIPVVPVTGGFAAGETLTVSMSWTKAAGTFSLIEIDLYDYDAGAVVGSATIVPSALNGSGSATITLASATSDDLSFLVDTTYTLLSPNYDLALACAPVAGPPPPPVGDESATLETMQRQSTIMAAQTSAQAVVSSVSQAIDDAFSGAPTTIAPGDGSLRISYAPGTRPASGAGALASLAGDAPSSLPAGLLGYDAVSDAGQDFAPALPWRVWGDIRYTGWETSSAWGEFRGDQVNGLAGLTWLLDRAFLVGAYAGYERFEHESDPLAARFAGEGWTLGAYAAWKPSETLRLDVTAAYTGMDYEGSAGAVTAALDGSRALVSAGLTGTHRLGMIELEPSARLTALWLHEDAYVDSASVAHAERDASSLRFAAGLKAGYPIALENGSTLTPFAGLYGNYQASDDDAGTADFILDGFSLRMLAGMSLAMPNGAKLTVDGDVAGLGSGDAIIWSGRAKLSIPF